ncbi:MAG: hypothetical protein JKP92_06005 [Alphaproteobacteria bacterium]|jgi:hypothetical protein|nr:hypothetical protein [Alphaproteobacteria bacterium]
MTTPHTTEKWDTCDFGLTTILETTDFGLATILETAMRGIVVRNENGTVAFIPGNDKAECEARARLIAAAPETAAERDQLKAQNAELLACLDEMLGTYAMDDPRYGMSPMKNVFSVWDRARAAIAKARGAQS